MLKRALIWGAVGVGVALVVLLVSLFTHANALADVALALWPGSFGLMALDSAATTRLDWVGGTAFLVLTNFVLYFIVRLMVTLAWEALTKLRAHTPPAPRLG